MGWWSGNFWGKSASLGVNLGKKKASLAYFLYKRSSGTLYPHIILIIFLFSSSSRVRSPKLHFIDEEPWVQKGSTTWSESQKGTFFGRMCHARCQYPGALGSFRQKIGDLVCDWRLHRALNWKHTCGSTFTNNPTASLILWKERKIFNDVQARKASQQSFPRRAGSE